MAKGKRHSAKVPIVVVALPFAYREGVDEYNGVMRFLRESGEEWNLRIIRHSFGVELFRDFPVEDLDGDFTVERDVERTVDSRHAAFALRRFEQIVVEPLRDDEVK